MCVATSIDELGAARLTFAVMKKKESGETRVGPLTTGRFVRVCGDLMHTT